MINVDSHVSPYTLFYHRNPKGGSICHSNENLEQRIIEGKLIRDDTIAKSRNRTSKSRKPQKFEVGDRVYLQIDSHQKWISDCKIAQVTDRANAYWVEKPSGSCILRAEQYIRHMSPKGQPVNTITESDENVNSYFS